MFIFIIRGVSDLRKGEMYSFSHIFKPGRNHYLPVAYLLLLVLNRYKRKYSIQISDAVTSRLSRNRVADFI